MMLKALRKRFRSARAETARPREGPVDGAKAAALAHEGGLLAEQGRHEDAADSFSLALAFDPSLLAAWIGYAQEMRACNRLQDAINHLQKAVALAPGSSEAWLELGRALNQAGQTAEAAAAYQKAIEADPEHAAPYVNLGLLSLAQLGDAPRAETLFRRAIELVPQRIEPQVNLGLALHEQGRSNEALEHYDRLVQDDPHCAEYRWHRACVRLALGDFGGGWEDYEARKQRDGQWRLPPPFREWDGRPLARGALLVYAEQGIGDEIMFASCLNDLMRVTPECVVECDERVGALFRRSFPHTLIEGVDRRRDDWSWLAKYPQITAQCAIGSLPRYFRLSGDAFSGAAPYLVPDPVRVKRWRESLGADEPRLKIGIAWRGGTYKTRRELRSTTLRDWAPLLSSRFVRCYALQSPTQEELAAAGESVGEVLHDLCHVDRDIEELTAAIAALDLIITVQGTLVHLAGAVGRPVWVLLNHSAEWRYMGAGERMPWYPTARLFRQPEPQAWGEVFGAIAQALSQRGSPLNAHAS